jgi:hypothetical protein
MQALEPVLPRKLRFARNNPDFNLSAALLEGLAKSGLTRLVMRNVHAIDSLVVL